MATSIGQHAPGFLPGEPPSLTEKIGSPQSTGLQRVRRHRGDPAHTHKTFFACGSSAPMKAEHEAAWLTGTLLAPRVQGHGLLPPQELRPYQSLCFEPLVAGDQAASLASLSP